MSNISNLLQDSKAAFATQRNETQGYVTKWEKTGLLEGLGGEYDKHNTAILLENQAKQLISEANNTATANDEWNGVALPLVRRIFAEISAKDFVSVQPMNLPSGLVFWLDFKYGNDKFPVDNTQSIFGSNGKAATTDFTKGLYPGPGRSAYSMRAPQSTASVTLAAKGTKLNAGGFTKADLDMGLSAYAVSGSTEYAATSFDQATGEVTFSGMPGATDVVTVHYHQLEQNGDVSTAAGLRGDFEAQHTVGNELEEAQLNIPELEVSLESEALVAKTRKLKVVWTPEFAQDLNAYHSIDAEAELTSMLSEYIAMEIDLEILEMLHSSAGFSGTWVGDPTNASAKGYQTSSGSLGLHVRYTQCYYWI